MSIIQDGAYGKKIETQSKQGGNMKKILINKEVWQTRVAILEDDLGTLWMSTNGGISNYDPDTQQMRNYGLDEGLMALEYNQNAFARITPRSGATAAFGSAAPSTGAFISSKLDSTVLSTRVPR